MAKPHILYFHTHDTGRFTQPYGKGVKSPNIQALAEDGVLFRNAHCVGPTCSPSRASLLTGQYPHTNGMLGLAHRGWELIDKEKHLCNVLKNHGYETVISGLQHVTTHRENLGYDRDLLEEGERPFVKNVLPHVQNFLREDHDKPFFLSVGFTETHLKYLNAYDEDTKADIRQKTKEWAKYMTVPSVLPDREDIRESFAEFQYDLLVVDDALGQIIETLKEKDLYNNTIIICTTDHGVALPRMKCTLTDQGSGVTLIMKGPGVVSGGKAVDAMVSHMDVYPTLCDLIEIDKPDWLQGSSMLPLISGTQKNLHDALFFEVTYHAGYEPKRAIRTDRWKYIKRFDDKQLTPVMANIDASPAKDAWLEYDYPSNNLEQEYLFDLVFDPTENNNLAKNPEYQVIKEELEERLITWMEDTKDPLLNGPVPLVAHGLVCKRNAMHPGDQHTIIKGKSWNEKYL